MSTTSIASFADLLRQHRLAAGLTQEALGERAGLSVHGIQKLERGATRPYRDTSNRLIDALGLTGEARSEFEAAAAPAPRHRAAATLPRTEVILYHASEDGPTVERVAAQLRDAGLSPRTESSVVGDPRDATQVAESSGPTPCAVFVSSVGLSNWDAGPLGIALRSPERTGVPRLIPVLLPGAPEPFAAASLPPVLQTQPWVDFRAGLDNPHALAQLVTAIRGAPVSESDWPQALAGSVCPYRGLESFELEHAELFFGREAAVQRLIEHLKASRFLAVVAHSGSGKSSLVRAGLLPALRRGALPDSTTWHSVLMFPGAEPLTALATELVMLSPSGAIQPTLEGLATDARTLHLAVSLALARQPRTARVVLVVDQFEELFSQCWDQAERAQFVANLLYAATVPDGRTMVILTMRADFYAHCIDYPELAASIAANQHPLSPMDDDGLRQAIEGPARRTGLTFEPGLVDTILEDVVGEPGALPLLEYALTELWNHRRATLLTLEGYRTSGGVHGALALRAEQVYAAFSPAEQAVARQVFLRLVESGEGIEDSRRRVDVSELTTMSAGREITERVLGALVAARLLTASGDSQTGNASVEVAHEALIRNWPRLRSWLDENRADLRVHRRLMESAREWQRLGREDEALIRGARLAEAADWRTRHEDDLNALEREFLDGSAMLQDRNRRLVERRRRRVTLLLGIGLGIALALGAGALLLWRQAELARQLALAQELGFEADSARRGLAVELPRSVLLAAEALRRGPAPLAERTLRLDLAMLAKPVTTLPHPDRVQALAYSPDGQRLATASVDGLARVWDSTSGQELLELPHDAAVQAVSYSPSGEYLATGGDDGTVRTWDASTGRPVLVLPQTDRVYAVAFSPDGARIASATRDGHVYIWNALTGQGTAQMAHAAPLPATPFSPDGTQHAEAPGPAMAFSPDSQLLITGRSADKTARIWDVATGRPVAVLQHDDVVHGVTFSPGGDLAATASVDGSVRLWNPRTGEPVARMALDKSFPAYTVAFSPDGHALAAAGYQFNAKTWDVPTGKELLRLPHSDAVQALAFSPDGRFIATAGNESTAHLWDARSGQEVGRVTIENATDVYALAFSSDGQRLAVIADNDQVSVWQTTKPWQVTGLSHPGVVYGAAFSPDGRFLGTGSADGGVRIWDATTGALMKTWETRGAVYPVQFSNDGQLVVAGSYDGNVYVWDRATGAELARLGQGDVVFAAALSPDGRLLAAGTQYGYIRVWDWRSRSEVLHMQHAGGVQGLAFTADEQRLISASLDGTLRAWDLKHGTELVRLAVPDGHQIYSMTASSDDRLVATGEIGAVRIWDLAQGREINRLPHDSLVNDVAFSPDDQLLASAGRDGTVRVFSVATGQEAASMAHALSANAVAFSPDGRLLATASDDRTARVWPLAPANLLDEACSSVARNLSTEEWQQYLPDQLYRKTCPNLN